MSIKLELTNRADEQDRLGIFNPLIKFNNDIVGDAQYQPLNVIIRDETGQSIGGLWGHTAYGWFALIYLFVPQKFRNQGTGKKIVTIAECEAVARMCHGAYVDTHEFQARAFYEKLGYELFGELPDFPVGHRRFFLRKTLKQADP